MIPVSMLPVVRMKRHHRHPPRPPLEPERIQQCERLFSLGALAAGLIHELNNPLNAILMNAELGLLRLQKASDQDELLRILQKISQEAKRGGLLTRNVVEFAKTGVASPNGKNCTTFPSLPIDSPMNQCIVKVNSLSDRLDRRVRLCRLWVRAGRRWPARYRTGQRCP